MTRTVTGPAVRPLPRFTFAGRGCRDPRREPRTARRAATTIALHQPPCGTVPARGTHQER
jgi:hypothetical protein